MSEDLKIKSANGKAPLGLIPFQTMIGCARVYEYGGVKYTIGNWRNATVEDGAAQRYPDALLRHLMDMQDPGGQFTAESVASIDPESGLPNIDHAITGLTMLRGILTKCGVLPADPGKGNPPPGQEQCTTHTDYDNPDCKDRDKYNGGGDCAAFLRGCEPPGITVGSSDDGSSCRSCRRYYGGES